MKWKKLMAGAVGDCAYFVPGPRAMMVNYEGKVHLWRDSAWADLPPLKTNSEDRAFAQSADGELFAYCAKSMKRLSGDKKWTAVGKAGGPGPRYGITLCAYEQGLLAFGGQHGKVSGETWLLADDAWTQNKKKGPPARARGHAVAIDGGATVLLFAGSGKNDKELDDAWAFSGGAWKALVKIDAGYRNKVCLPYFDAQTEAVLGLPYGYDAPYKLAVWRDGQMATGPEPLPGLAKGSYDFGIDLASRTVLAVKNGGKATYALPLDEVLAACAPAAGAVVKPRSPKKERPLRKASTAKQIAALEKVIGFELAAAVREYFTTDVFGERVEHDPALDAPTYELYSAADAAREWKLMRGISGVRWEKSWIPIANDGAGNLHYADNGDSTVGYVCHDPPDEKYSELSPLAWLEQLRREVDDDD